MKRQYHPWTEEEKDFLRNNYPEMGSLGVSEALRHTQSSVHRMAMKMKLKVSESGMKNIQYNKSVKQRATHKRLYRTERLRKLSGLQQKTGMLINLFPKRIQNVVNKYICVRKYFHCEGEPFDVLYYDENTKRTSHESIMSARYGIKFVQYDDGKNETELI